MTAAEIQRALRLITSKPQRQRFPVTTIAQLAGLSRETIYQARAGRGLTERVVEALAPVLRDVLTGSLQACQERRSGRTQVQRLTRDNFGSCQAAPGCSVGLYDAPLRERSGRG